MLRVLITGADGFIGNRLTLYYLQNNCEVDAIIYPGSKAFEAVDNGLLHIHEIDLNCAYEYASQFQNEIDVMYHFAWKGVCPEQRNDYDIQMSNIDMTMECMKLATVIGVKKLILLGSTNEYMYYGKPINKNAPPSPGNAYGAVKTALRYLCAEYAAQNGIDFIYVILTGIYAADRRDNNVIFYTIDKLLKGEKPSLTRLEQLWDYIYIDDAIGGLAAVGWRGKAGNVYAIGHGDNMPLRNYIEIIHQKIDPLLPLGIGEVPYTNDRLPSSCVDLTDLTRDTGFTPKISFNEGITRVIDTMRGTRRTNT